MTETTANPFDSSAILDGIRRWVEIETPTEAPEQVNKLADLVTDGYRGLPAAVERIAGKDGCGDHLVARSSWGQDAPGILVLSHLDTVHPMGFIERLPFKVEGDSAFGPGIYDMKGGAYLAYHAFRQICADGARSPLGVTQSTSPRGNRQSDFAGADRGRGRRAKYVLVTEPARRRQDRNRAQGRSAVRGFHQGRAGARRLAARGWPQRHPRTRQRHSDAGSDERPQARH
jgi:glutamate carboxypeptidase